MGFKVISLMNLTREEMYAALHIFYSLLGEGVYGLVYFAGHGFEEGGQNYLVPVDTVGEWLPQDAVCAQKMLDEMNRYQTELIVFLLDICRKRYMNRITSLSIVTLCYSRKCPFTTPPPPPPPRRRFFGFNPIPLPPPPSPTIRKNSGESGLVHRKAI